MNFTRLLSTLVVLSLVQTCLSLYEDQVGVNDWQRKHVGVAHLAEFGGQFVYMTTEVGVVAALNAKDGSIAWRHRLPENEVALDGPLVGSLVLSKDSVFTMSKSGKFVRRFRKGDGGLLWSASTFPKLKQGQVSRSAGGVIKVVHDSGDVVVHANGAVSLISGDSGAVTWTVDLSATLDGDVVVKDLVLVDGEDTVNVACVQEDGVAVVVDLSLESGRKNDVHVVQGSFSDATAVLDAGVPVVVFLASGAQPAALLFNTKTGETANVALESVVGGGEIVFAADKLASGPFVRVSVGGVDHVLMVSASDKSLTSVHSSKNGGLVVGSVMPSEGAKPALVGSPVTEFSASSRLFWVQGDRETAVSLLNDNESWASVYGRLFRGAFQAVPLKQTPGAYALRSLLVFSDGATVCVQSTILADGKESASNKIMWVREEGLSAIAQTVSVEFPPLLVESEDAGELDILETGSEVDVLAARLKSQLSYFTNGVASLSEVVTGGLEFLSVEGVEWVVNTIKGTEKVVSSYSEKEKSVYGFKHILVLLSKTGKLFGMRSDTGDLLWSRVVTAPRESAHVHVARGRETGSHPPVVMVVDSTGNAVWVNAVNGKVMLSEEAPRENAAKLETGTALPLTHALEEHHHTMTPYVAVDSHGDVRVFPRDLTPLVVNEPRTKTTVLFNVGERAVRGYGLNVVQGKVVARERWSHVFPPGHGVVSYTSINPADKANSAAVPLGDGSVMLKYLNPHMVAVATLPVGGGEGEGLVVYLLDVVSGNLIHRVAHKSGAGAVEMQLVENWLLYSYWNSRQKRTELSSISIFESAVDKYALNPWSFSGNTTGSTFSSFDASKEQPIVLQKTYALGLGVRGMGATLTHHGITSKNLLVVLKNGQLLSLDRKFVDPRRPSGKITAAQKKEGLFEYHAEVPMIPLWMLTYNQTLLIDSVMSMPAKLESTSLVFANGIDMFYTRATPSLPFDLLAEDFNHSLLIVLTSGLLVAVLAMRKMVNRKKLYSQWK